MSIPQQHKLMGSSAQNSPGVDWCKGPGQVQRGSGEGSEGSGESTVVGLLYSITKHARSIFFEYRLNQLGFRF